MSKKASKKKTAKKRRYSSVVRRLASLSLVLIVVVGALAFLLGGEGTDTVTSQDTTEEEQSSTEPPAEESADEADNDAADGDEREIKLPASHFTDPDNPDGVVIEVGDQGDGPCVPKPSFLYLAGNDSYFREANNLEQFDFQFPYEEAEIEFLHQAFLTWLKGNLGKPCVTVGMTQHAYTFLDELGWSDDERESFDIVSFFEHDRVVLAPVPEHLDRRIRMQNNRYLPNGSFEPSKVTVFQAGELLYWATDEHGDLTVPMYQYVCMNPLTPAPPPGPAPTSPPHTSPPPVTTAPPTPTVPPTTAPPSVTTTEPPPPPTTVDPCANKPLGCNAVTPQPTETTQAPPPPAVTTTTPPNQAGPGGTNVVPSSVLPTTVAPPHVEDTSVIEDDPTTPEVECPTCNAGDPGAGGAGI